MLNNKFNEVPKCIKRLKSLRSLFICDNELIRLPEWLLEEDVLPKLEYISISRPLNSSINNNYLDKLEKKYKDIEIIVNGSSYKYLTFRSSKP